jgi:hypothetical protein
MLVSLHALVNIICDYAPIFHAHSYEILKLLFIRGLAPIRLGFASRLNVCVVFPAEFI